MHIIKYYFTLLLVMTCTSLQCDEHLKIKEANSIFNHIKANESDLVFSKIDLQDIQNVDYLLSGFWNGLGDLCKAYTNIAILQLNEETFRGSHGIEQVETIDGCYAQLWTGGVVLRVGDNGIILNVWWPYYPSKEYDQGLIEPVWGDSDHQGQGTIVKLNAYRAIYNPEVLEQESDEELVLGDEYFEVDGIARKYGIPNPLTIEARRVLELTVQRMNVDAGVYEKPKVLFMNVNGSYLNDPVPIFHTDNGTIMSNM